MELQFLGATGTVTGSKYLLRHETGQMLVDCGLFQGYKQLRLRNWAPLPVAADKIAAIVLTHAHIDHSGYLPLLARNGFAGRIHCTPATRDLCEILLPDSGHLQEEEAEYANRRGFSKHHPALPLYTVDDARACLRLFAPVGFETDFQPLPGVTARLIPSGHILGAGLVRIEAAGMSVLFSGDLGRPRDLVMPAPTPVSSADYLVVESTYGDRIHDPADPSARLADVINRTAARGGVVVIPAFAVGRTQQLLYFIHLLKRDGLIPDLPVYLNSPMATDATRIFQNHLGEHRLSAEQSEAMGRTAHIVRSADESRALNERQGPMIIVAASGMATGGRVVHHLKAFAPDARNSILFAGFQAGGTRGAAMIAGAKFIRIHGEEVPVRAEVASINNLSAHADAAEILEWLGGFRAPPRRTFITHGEPQAADALRFRIEHALNWDCLIPDYLESYALA